MTPTYLQQIDMLIAQHEYGYSDPCVKYNNISATLNGAQYYIPAYSQSIAAAWPLAEKYNLSLIRLPDSASWRICLFREGFASGQVEHASAPLCICIATLKLLGVELPKEDAK